MIENMTTPRRRIVATLAMMGCLAFFFRDALFARLHVLYGDSYDGLIEVAILDHWYLVYTAGSIWNTTGYFFPHLATLGYNDAYFLQSLPFSLARSVGADPFLATFVSHVAMRIVAFSGMYALLRRGLQVRTEFALAGAAIFTTANASLIHMYHAQLLSIGILPWLGLFVLRTIACLRRDDTGPVLIYAAGFVLLYGATALSAFYGLWFFTLFLLICMPVAWALASPEEIRSVKSGIVRHRWILALCVLVGAVALLPALTLYLPKASAGARHQWQDGPLNYLPRPRTLINVGTGNLVWGDLLAHRKPLPGGEDRVGIPIGMIVVTIAAIFWAARSRPGSNIILAVGITVLIMTGLALRWPGGHSAWWLVYTYLPGAGTIRVVDRLLLFALVGIVPLVLVFLDRIQLNGWVKAAIIAWLLVEQVQSRAPLTLDREAQMAMITSIGAPPEMCRSFFVLRSRPADYPLLSEASVINRSWGGDGNVSDLFKYRHNVDAMLLASFYGVPTINGYSSFNPPDWMFADPYAPDYLSRVRTYAMRHRLSGLCGLDVRRTPSWYLAG